MKSISEIEAAIQQLPASQLEELIIWLGAHRARQASPLAADAWLKRARGAARLGATTAQIMSLTRGEDN